VTGLRWIATGLALVAISLATRMWVSAHDIPMTCVMVPIIGLVVASWVHVMRHGL
jgi:hypothetical protein